MPQAKTLEKLGNTLDAELGFRSLEVRAKTFDEETRSVEATISTETPVPMPDWARMEMVPEILLAKGAEFPKSRQVPFLDSHNRYSVKDQLGSARGIEVKDTALSARLHFSRAAQSDEAMAGVRDGHITDVSVGYEILKRVFVPAGESKTISGRQFDGPVNVVTKWRLREVSLTPIGADAQAKLRGLDPAAVRFQSQRKDEFEMNPELRKLLVSRGMPAELSDEQAQEWAVRNFPPVPEQKTPEPPKEPERKEQAPVIDEDKIAGMIADKLRQAEQARKKQLDEINALCDLAELPEEAETCRGLESVEKVREHLKAAKAKKAEQIPFGSVRVMSTGHERLSTDIRSALAFRAVSSAVNGDPAKLEKYLPAAERSKTADGFRHATLFDMAQEFVRSQGIQTLGLTREQVAQCAMFGPRAAGIRSGGPYHTTGSFANLTLDAINKSLTAGYSEFPATWRGPMRQGDSVADFKQIHRVRLGGIPNLPVWNDTEDPNKASMADAKESYAVEARSIGIDFSYKLIVNDDMSALTRTPMMLGAAASRTVNALAWSQITSNPTMSDSVALFATATGARKRTNLTTGAGAPSVATLQTLSNLMRLMHGENTPEGNEGPEILNLQPRYLVGPSALDTTIKQLVLSAYDPASSLMVYNTATQLIPVIEPLLDADSTTAWYLFAETSQIDTVEVTFLQGHETPQVREVMDEHKLAMTYYVLQCVGAKPLNHRGVQKHAGV